MPTDTVNVSISLNAKSIEPRNWTDASNSAARSTSHNFTNGTGTGQINLIVHGSTEVAFDTSPNQVIVDLNDFTDLFGTTGCRFSEIKVMWFRNLNAESRVHLDWTMNGSYGTMLGEEGAYMSTTPYQGFVQDEPPEGGQVFACSVVNGQTSTLEWFFAGLSI